MRVTQGLEDVAAGELRALPGVRVEAVQHRTVSGVTTGPLAALVGLRAADDAFLELARFDGMERARCALVRLGEAASAVDLRPALAALGRLRALPPEPRASVSASFVGRRNYTTTELKEVLAAACLARQGHALEVDDRAAPLHLRLVLLHGEGRLGLRIAREPLHERGWKRVHVPGSLKPPVAAALWRLAGLAAGARALDVCCGAGTLLAEAAEAGAHALGGDRDPEAVRAAAANLRGVALPASVSCWDARALPLPPACIDAAASNLPWGRQVRSEAPLEALYAGLAHEIARVLAPGGRAVVLTSAPDRLPSGPLRLEARREIGLFGRRASVLVLSRPVETV